MIGGMQRDEILNKLPKILTVVYEDIGKPMFPLLNDDL